MSHLRWIDPRSKDQQVVPLSPESVFVPTLPVIVSGESDEPQEEVRQCNTLALLRSSDVKGLALNVSDGNRLLSEEQRSLQERQAHLAECFPAEGLCTRHEAFLHVTLLHSIQNSEGWGILVDYMEGM